MVISVIYVTFPRKKDAENVLSMLISKKIVACGGLFKVKSFFNWEGKSNLAGEFAALCKTKSSLVKLAEKEILAVHPYKVPCILSWKVSSNKSYEKWVKEVTK
jgi:periplasmic divalent cation tolerance protein